jgi:NTP pyrophosphatase (non-canonical NTP hydrolase)
MELTIRDYYRAAKRTINPLLTWEQTRSHALHGIASECGEIHGLYQKVYQGHDLVKERVMDEAGNLMWFIMELCFAEGIDPEEMLAYNIDKLCKRYPDGFDPQRSLHRGEAGI